MPNENPKSRDAAIAEVIRRATVDRAFREWLLKEPHSALADVLGRPVPSHIRIRCIEKDADVDALIVLPHFVAENGEQAVRPGSTISQYANSASRGAAE
jgi:hypothetical protein